MQRLSHSEMISHIKNRARIWTGVLNASAGKVRNATTVRKLDLEKIQDALKEAQRLSLHAVADIQANGLTFDTDIKDKIISTENVSTMEAAQCSMNVVQMEVNDTKFGITSVPQPITHHTHGIHYRENHGYKITQGNIESMRQVMEVLESNLVNGNANIVVYFNGANQILYGYTSHPNRTTVAIDDWASSVTNVLANVRSMMSAMFNTNKIEGEVGSMILYVPSNSWIPLRGQAFSSKGSLTLEKQILSDHPEISKVVPSTKLATGNPVLVYMKAKSVQMGVAQNPVTIPHIKNFILLPDRYTTYAVMTPVIHVDVNSLTGIVQGT